MSQYYSAREKLFCRTFQEKDSFTRRQFIYALGSSLAALYFGGLVGCAPKTKAQAEISDTVCCDVLVVGGGGAGITAAGHAAEQGAHTILLEKMSQFSGSSTLALGTFYGAGTMLQKKAGIRDSSEGLLAYFLSRGGNKLNLDMQRFCADHFGETIDWLIDDLKVPFKEAVSLKGSDTVPRAHNCANNAMDVLSAVIAFATDRGVEFLYNRKMESLSRADDGSIEGVVARLSTGQLVRYKAKKTIIASGGFCRNADMINRYCPDYEGVYTEVGPGCTGEGLQIGLDLGADYVGHGGTNGILACAVEPGQSKLISSKALWIDKQGKRFANEGGQTHDVYYQVARFPDQHFFALYDQSMRDELDDHLSYKFRYGMEQGIFTQGNTVEEAARQLGIDGLAAQATLNAYNELAQVGKDTQFQKKAALLKPLQKPPFYVLQMGVCTHGSFGGYNVNTKFEVLDSQGVPFKNLYAAGEVSCGTFIYDDYPAGGCGLNWAYTSGRYAGRNAATALNS